MVAVRFGGMSSGVGGLLVLDFGFSELIEGPSI
jgi:hypothetical protein